MSTAKLNSMKRSFFLVWLFCLNMALVQSQSKQPAAPAPFGAIPTAAQLNWHEMEMNAFIHFTTNTFTDKEWGYGDEAPAIFNPTQLNTDQWASALQQAGFKTLILTCKHHDGFCLWPSAYTDHSLKNSPYKNGQGDIVKEASNSARKFNLKFGVYLSPWDRNRADYGTPSYISYYRNQLKELFTQYGPVFEMWFDGANGGDGYYGGAKEKRQINGAAYYDWPTTLNEIRKIQPNVIFFSDAGPGVRWVGNESGIAGTTNWNTISTDSLYAGKPGIEQLLGTGAEDGKQWVPAEVDVSIRPGWFYHAKEDSLVRTPENLFQIYLSSVGRGSTMLLNIPPDRRGLFHENDLRSLAGFRAILNKVFAKNLAFRASVKASNNRGNSRSFAAANLTDGNKASYWATDDAIRNATVEITLAKPALVQYIVLQEYIKLGQRIKSFQVEIWQHGHWVRVGEGTTVGHKRILAIQPVTTKKIRVIFENAKACLVMSAIEVF
jgi:alpha-L-fucosidase